MKSRPARATNKSARKSKKKDKKAMEQAKDRRRSHSARAVKTDLPETPDPPRSSRSFSIKHSGQVEEDQVLHESCKEAEDERGKQHNPRDTFLKSGNNHAVSSNCSKLNGGYVHSEVQIDAQWFDVTDIRPEGNKGRRLEGMLPGNQGVLRPRLRSVLSRMRREHNTATEEALAKSRGDKAYQSWKAKQSNAAPILEVEENGYEASRGPAREDSNTYSFPSSPTSRRVTPPFENTTLSGDSTPMPEHNKSRRGKRKRKADLAEAQKRRKLTFEPGPAQEDISAAEEATVAAHKNKVSAARPGSKPQSLRLSPFVEIITNTTSGGSLQKAHKLASITVSRSNSISSGALEGHAASDETRLIVPTVAAIKEKGDALEEFTGASRVESTPLEPNTSPRNARRDSSREEIENRQGIPHNVLECCATPDHRSLTIERPARLEESGGLLNQDRTFTGTSAQPASQIHQDLPNSPTSYVRHNSTRHVLNDITSDAQQTRPLEERGVSLSMPSTSRTTPISLESDPEDDLEIISVKIAPTNLKKAQGDPPVPSPQNGLSRKPRQPSKPCPDTPAKDKKMSLSPAKPLSQTRKKGPPGVKELPTGAHPTLTNTRTPLNVKPGHRLNNNYDAVRSTSPGLMSGSGFPPREIEVHRSKKKTPNTTAPAEASTQARSGRKKGPPGLKTLPSANSFTPALVGYLINTKPGPIAVDEDADEELISPESSPGPGIARVQIEARLKETKFVHQKPLPISISSDEDSDDDSSTTSRANSISELHLQYRGNNPQGGTTALKPTPWKTSFQASSHTPERTSRSIVEQHEMWPEESRGSFAQAAIEYLNAVPQNKQIPMAAAEMLSLLGEQPEFNELCSQIKKSGRTFTKPAFARALLSELESDTLENPIDQTVTVNLTPPSRVEASTAAKLSLDVPGKMTPGLVMDTPPGSALSRYLVNPATGPRTAPKHPRVKVVRALPKSREVISLIEPDPTSTHETPSEHVPKQQKVSRLTADSNISSSEVIVLDSPALSSSFQPHYSSHPATHGQTRINEVLDHIAKRLLLHEGPDILTQFVKFTIAQIVEEEYNLFNAEKAVAKRQAGKVIQVSKREQRLSKSVRQPDFSVYNRFPDRLDRARNAAGTTGPLNFEWTWSVTGEMETKKIRARSTSISLPSEPIAQAPMARQAFPLTPRKIRGRSTTPELWLMPSQRDTRTDSDELAKSEGQSDDSESTATGDDFFDAEESLSTETI
ncbi:hypothetical protein FKW77_003036 [Venturia effusa]|uniref:Uncharacterized protein n=1 Tax=Venturia effusa TaxID=50376 RepID=A0A517KVY7_9PEZI|nr:hypothetical protein FKW77_003036 [Venturia effusa]